KQLNLYTDKNPATLEQWAGLEKNDDFFDEAKKQIIEYFEGTRKVFNLKLSPEGTDFQKKVWKALLDIPYGETRSYQDIAKNIGNPKACRAIGNANNKNPIPLIIPCHRVIGKNGNLVGYGAGIDLKKTFLDIERDTICPALFS
ncbi:MAG: methylated-DNA--[protein]-cysteine S-methyltransferase, partial [Spirochaetales bacterium]|nr:methylated-DNA--[protein]-cysteine S-methyltransferase [Spirochaetales bacterium]